MQVAPRQSTLSLEFYVYLMAQSISVNFSGSMGEENLV